MCQLCKVNQKNSEKNQKKNSIKFCVQSENATPCAF